MSQVEDVKSEEEVVRDVLLARIDKAGLQALNQVLRSGSAVPHNAEMLESILKLCGGVDVFAALMWKQFHESAPGSGARTKLIETVVRLTVANTAVGGAKKPLHLMDDDEIELELQDKIKRTLERSIPRRITNVE